MNNNVSSTNIVIGILLIIVGLLGRFLTGTTSITAFIPLFFGVPIAVLGWLGRNPDRTRWTTIAVIALAVLGAVGAANVVADIFTNSASMASILSRGSMLVLCVLLINIGGVWLVQNR
ncbi:MAG: hypothetical protein AAGD96_02785 [Chloroflexota bacterium]